MRYFSLFSGIGGLEYGLREVGECVGISEIKESSVKIHEKNFGKIKNFGDITKVELSKLPNFNGLLGGFPCQSFSLAGARKGFKDRRGKMIFYIYDILKIKKPEWFVLENVKGILNHNKGDTFKDVVKLLSFAGYNVRVVLLNSLFYGSVQNRERVFFLGHKEDFEVKIPEIIDNSKRFKDIKEIDGGYKFIRKTERIIEKIEQKRVFNFELIGLWDRVGTLTTQYGCGEKLVYEEAEDSFRYLTVKECERLQGFPDGWTDGISENARYWALGNAVNCNVSEYLFNNYLEDLWKLTKQKAVKV